MNDFSSPTRVYCKDPEAGGMVTNASYLEHFRGR